MMRPTIGEARELIDAYTGALDAADFDGWLGLFAEEGYYACLRWVEYEQGNNVLLIGEDMRRLRARIQAGRQQDRRRMAHATSSVRLSATGVSLSAVFALWYDGVPTYAGRYRIELAGSSSGLQIRRCTAILDNEVVTSPIFMPI